MSVYRKCDDILDKPALPLSVATLEFRCQHKLRSCCFSWKLPFTISTIADFSGLVLSILLICGCHICELAYLLKFICNSQINSRGASRVMCGHVQSGNKFELTAVSVLS